MVWTLLPVVSLGTLQMLRLKEHLPQEIPSVKNYLSNSYLNVLFAPKKHEAGSSTPSLLDWSEGKTIT